MDKTTYVKFSGRGYVFRGALCREESCDGLDVDGRRGGKERDTERNGNRWKLVGGGQISAEGRRRWTWIFSWPAGREKEEKQR